MIYVFDSGPLIDSFRHFYVRRFPTFWQDFENLVSSKRILSVSEVARELEDWGDRLSEWVKDHRGFFLPPSVAEFDFVADIFKITHFQTIIKKKERLLPRPVADPFVIAKARILEGGCVVTQEKFTENAARIPNVCKHFDIPCIDLEGFMEQENWIF